jgi:hypothetical protein
MSTIKSSDEHLTLNADGSSKDIKFQANGVEKASISSAGAFTSTTIDATKLTGDLPAISGANLTGLSASDATKLPLAGGTITGLLKVYPSNGQMRLSDNQETKYAMLEASNGRLFLHCDPDNAEANTDFRIYMDGGEKLKIYNAGSWSHNFGNGDWGHQMYAGGTGAQAFIDFRLSNNSQVGYITSNGSSTTYATSSDYRLKENVDYTWDATTRLKQLKPARFNFIADDTNTLVDGFIAHEVQEIVPEAVTGEKDAMEAAVLYKEGDDIPDGKSVGDVRLAEQIAAQAIDQSKLVPLLVKTIQELEARITALES